MKSKESFFIENEIEAGHAVVIPKSPSTASQGDLKTDDDDSFLGYQRSAVSSLDSGDVSISQSNSLVSSSYRLTLDAKRLMNVAISKLDPMKAIDIVTHPDGRKEIKLPVIKVTKEEWINHFGGKENSSYERLKKAVDDLWDATAIVFKDDKSEEVYRWIEGAKYHDGEGFVHIVPTSKVLTHISMLYEAFTSYKIMNIGRLKTFHSIRLYELLSQFRSTGWRKMTIDDFKFALAIEQDSYSKFNDLHRRVIKKIVKEVNENTDIDVKYTLIRKGRLTVGIQFFINEKKQKELDL